VRDFLDRTVIELRGFKYWLNEGEGIDHAVKTGSHLNGGGWEPAAMSQLPRLVRPGAHCLDIGANIGIYTLELARCAGPSGRVIAVEPMAPAYRVLQEHVALNALVTVDTVQAFCGAEEEVERTVAVAFRNPTPVEPVHHIAPSVVPVVTVDGLRQRLGHVDFIKIDTDGYELQVLQGAAVTLRKDRPALLFELGDYTLAACDGMPVPPAPEYVYGAASHRLFEYLAPFDYAYFWEVEPLVERAPAELLTCTERLGFTLRNCTLNAFAVPREKVA
jgi:FkbM family methyltransferase